MLSVPRRPEAGALDGRAEPGVQGELQKAGGCDTVRQGCERDREVDRAWPRGAGTAGEALSRTLRGFATRTCRHQCGPVWNVG